MSRRRRIEDPDEKRLVEALTAADEWWKANYPDVLYAIAATMDYTADDEGTPAAHAVTSNMNLRGTRDMFHQGIGVASGRIRRRKDRRRAR